MMTIADKTRRCKDPGGSYLFVLQRRLKGNDLWSPTRGRRWLAQHRVHSPDCCGISRAVMFNVGGHQGALRGPSWSVLYQRDNYIRIDG